MARRVCVLGGGMASLAAALDLTDPRNPASEELEVTLYQVGWRLGGKGASGRNLAPGGNARIEEHGLHNLFGFYDNTFRLLRTCYDELARPEGHPLRSWRDGLSPESTAVFIEERGGRAIPWQLFNPTNRFQPGEGGAWLPIEDTLAMALSFLDLNLWHIPRSPPTPDEPTQLPLALRPLHRALVVAFRLLEAARRPSRLFPVGSGRRALARRAAERGAAAALEVARRGAWAALRGSLDDDRARRAWILSNFSTAILLGLLDEGMLGRDLTPLDEVNFRDWLLPRLLDDGGLTGDGVLMRVMYESSFAYRDGDTSIPPGNTFAPGADYGAGSLLRGMIRASLAYKAAFGWKFTWATGDVLFAPIYEVLRRRGVRFRFFHRVLAVEADEQGGRVERVVVARQARLREGLVDYEPLVEVRGVPCWPAHPRLEQLADAEALRGVDLESYRTPPGDDRLELERGRDFDDVVLGIPVGAHPYLCPDLIRKNARYAAMVQNLRTTRTQSLQIWGSRTARDAGFRPEGRPITGFWYDDRSPLNVWADLSHLIQAEAWGADAPVHQSWFVSPLRDEQPLQETPLGPVDDERGLDEGAARELVRASATRLLGEVVPRVLMPGLAAPGGGLDWSTLIDRRSPQGQGSERVEAQYYRANVSPSERYVLTVAGSTRFRLPAHDPTGFANLYFAGDWTRNGLDSGAMESAALSGRLASRALSGWPRHEDIPGACDP
jgi:uncharacterized protein with NAD-binding domain and iron-sulfur cluster